ARRHPDRSRDRGRQRQDHRRRGQGRRRSAELTPMAEKKPWAETAFERNLFRARWLMAPFYLGLVAALVMLLAVFVRELIYYVPQAFIIGEGHMGSDGAILAILSLVDLSLAGNLLLIVLYSGYENFVSKLDLDENQVDRPPWMGTVDFSGLKMKLIASIVAIRSEEHTSELQSRENL